MAHEASYMRKGGLADTLLNKKIVDSNRVNVLTLYDGKVLNLDGRHIDAKKGLYSRLLTN